MVLFRDLRSSRSGSVLSGMYREFLVRPARFERATYGLEGRCSIQLS